MKKYWPLLVVVAVIVATFGMHYVQIVSAANKNEITFETLIGDEQYVNNLTIDGSISSATDYNPMLITNGKAKIQYRSTYEHTIPQVFASLIKDYKKFMRGKVLEINYYYEDDEQLVYVKEPDDTWKLSPGDSLTFEVDVLNKATNESHLFTVNNKLDNEVQWITLEKIHVEGNNLKMITRHVNDSGKEIIHLTIFDMKEQQMIDDTIIETIQSTGDIYMGFSLYNEDFYIGRENYVVYNITEYDETKETSIPLSDRYYTLNLATNEITEIDMPEQIFGYAYQMVVHEHQFIVTTIIDEKIVLNHYNMGQQQWLEPMTIDMPRAVQEQGQFELHTRNGKLYLLAQTAEGQLLTIADALSGDTIYSGLVKSTIKQPNLSIMISSFDESTD